MAEINKIAFSHKEVVTALIQQQKIHEGIWGLYVEFGILAANIGPTQEDVNPAAIVPIVKMGLQKFDQLSNIAVDASEVNPKPK